MPVTHDIVERLLISYAQEIVPKRSITGSTRVCGDLGICDEDLWDMLDYTLSQLNVEKPIASSSPLINIHQRKLTISDLSEWICDFASEKGQRG